MESTVATVVSNTRCSSGAWRMDVKAPGIALAATPGQFVMVRCGTETEPLLRRPLSISDASKETGEITLLYSAVGKGTSLLSAFPTGQPINIIGPLGHGYDLRNSTRKVLLVAGGIGVAPLLFLAARAAALGISVTLIQGAATASEFCAPKPLLEGVLCRIATDDGSLGFAGRATDLIAECATGIDQIFACGPQDMYLSMLDTGALATCRNNIQVSLEVRMACGFGACNGCTVLTKLGPRKVCTDGPVFYLEDVLWNTVVV